MRAAGQAVGDQRRALGALLGHASAKPVEQPDVAELAPSAASRRVARPSGPRAMRPESTNLVGLGRRAPELARPPGRRLRRTPRSATVASAGSCPITVSTPPLKQRRLGHLARQERHLAVERAGGAPSDRAAVPPRPSTIWPRSTATPAVNAPPSSSRTSDTSAGVAPRRLALIRDRQRRRAHLVGGAHVHSVELAVRAAPCRGGSRRG